jgi:predicted aspartyl protease
VHKLIPLLLAPMALPGQPVPISVRGPVVVVSVQLNGRGPFRMIIDTGASSCSIAPRVAGLLQLSAEYRVLNVTPAGKRLIPGSRSVEVDLGTRVAKNVEFLWQDSRGLTEAGVEVDGVLGQSLLSRFDYLLDYKSGQLVLDSVEQQSAGRPGKQIKFARVAGRMLLPAMNPGEGSMRLILDSAASNVLLWRAGDYQALGATASLIAMNGRRVVNLIRMPLLVVGDQVLQRLDAVVAPSPDEDPQEDGLLPAALFRSIYVSNSETYVKLRR